MRKLLIILALCCLIGNAMAADTLMNPKRIDLSKNWSGQMHNVTNGSSDQDVATYSQLISAKNGDGALVGFSSDCMFQITTTFGADAAIQAASDWLYAKNGGGVVTLEAGMYNFSTSDRIDLASRGVVLRGASNMFLKQSAFYWNVAASNTTKPIGTIFRVFGTTNSPINIDADSITIENIAFWYPTQATNATPTAYAPSISIGESTQCNDAIVRGCNFYNSYIGIKGYSTSQKVYVSECSGSPIMSGIQYYAWLGNCPIIEKCHFYNGYDYRIGSVLGNWTADNGVAIDLYDFDGGIIEGCVAAGYDVGIRLAGTSVTGNSTDSPQISKCYIVGKWPLMISNAYRPSVSWCTLGAWDFYRSAVYPGDAIVLTNALDADISHNGIYSVGRKVLHVADSRNMRFSGNTIQGWDFNHGNLQLMTFDNECPGFQIVDNIFNGSLASAYCRGIYVGTNDNWQVCDNRFEGLITYSLYIESGAANFRAADNTWPTTANIIDGSGSVNKNVTDNLVY